MINILQRGKKSDSKNLGFEGEMRDGDVLVNILISVVSCKPFDCSWSQDGCEKEILLALSIFFNKRKLL